LPHELLFYVRHHSGSQTDTYFCSATSATISQAHITDQFRMVYDFPPEQICN